MRFSKIISDNLKETGDSFEIEKASNVIIKNNYPSRTIGFGFDANRNDTIELLPGEQKELPLYDGSLHLGKIFVNVKEGNSNGHINVLAIFPIDSESSS